VVASGLFVADGVQPTVRGSDIVVITLPLPSFRVIAEGAMGAWYCVIELVTVVEPAGVVAVTVA